MKINEKNLVTFACTPPVDLEGFLSKRGEVNKAWQRRWFVLKGNLLFYFEKRGDKEPLGVIILEGCTIELAEEGGENYCFKVIFHGEKDRSYLLASETQELMEKWMKALTCAGYEYMKLMVAELQRQLEELEESHGKVSQENGGCGGGAGNHRTGGDGSITGGGPAGGEQPKAPPRRHNPFNRPQGALNNGGFGDDVTIRQKDFSIHRQEPTTVTLVGNAAPGPSTTATNGSNNPTTEQEDNEDRFSFGTLHAALGQSFVQERLKRQKQEKEQEELLKEKSPEEEEEDQKTINEEDIKKKEEDSPTAHSLGSDHRTAIAVESPLESHF